MKLYHSSLATAAVFYFSTFLLSAADVKTNDKNVGKSEQVAKEYLESFKLTGIPTPSAVDAAIAKAKSTPSIENWNAAANVANSFANVVNVLKTHYTKVYDPEKAHFAGTTEGKQHINYLETAAKYEKMINKYLGMRNDAYIELAKIYLEMGDKFNALSCAIAAVELSGTQNADGEQLIRKIIEYPE